MGRTLVTGGAGYIGSQTVKYLRERGYQVLVLDNLSEGFRDSVPEEILIEGDIGNSELLAEIFAKYEIEAVINFASYIRVGDSFTDPSGYFLNNVNKTVILLNEMVRHHVSRFVFSSSAAIFGDPRYSPIDEEHPKEPINPYGRTKWIVEQLLPDYAAAYGLQSVCLRYFNAAGADSDCELGERHQPETHLIPLVLQAASGRREAITIYGDNYDTKDGTCVRDYIHVEDLAQAHCLALEYMDRNVGYSAFNLGSGTGYSIREVIDTARAVSGRRFAVEIGTPRAGDPSVLVADSSCARSELGWRPEKGNLEEIIKDAWRWEQGKGECW